MPLVGCQEQDTAAEPSVCPACDPRAGGETSDFGGTPTACWSMSGPIEIDADEAEALGYDVMRIRDLVGRGIDAPLRWEARADAPPRWDAGATDLGEPAQGYEANTRVRGEASISSFTHVRPDPQYCDGTTCTREGTSVEQATCPDLLLMDLRVELETLDGAITAVAHGDLTQWNDDPRFEPMLGPDAGAYPIGHAYANLHDVTGSLELFPPAGALGSDAGPLAVQAGHPFPGTLGIVLELMDDTTHGSVWPEIWWEVVDEDGNDMLESYRPLRGTWPDAE